ncbi:hypothetical protein GGR50DRAFT_650708 [Xylaria sp. CBS 124048]|nr:hypothetical protein GGR50DRAFT_650708 [Xylaria sp. CBS 124048]
MSASNDEPVDIDTSRIQSWRAILTLIVFVIANITVLFPAHISLPVPVFLYSAGVKGLVHLRVIPARRQYNRRPSKDDPNIEEDGGGSSEVKPYVWFRFPINFVTGPLIADLFLLAVGAIGRTEVKGGVAGSDNIVPYDILLFFFSLAYIAISIDASGLIRYLAFKVLQLGGKVGHRLFFFLYLFFFGLGSFIGNDPIILSGTTFLAYMTRVSSNIIHPRAWIHTQFAIANIASAILVSSNPTNLVLAGAFNIKFIDYTRDMVVPVVITAIVLFPFLLYIVFASESLIPSSITMHELDEAAKARKPVNPNIPYGRGTAGEEEKQLSGNNNNDASQLLSLEEIMNPFLDKFSAAFGGFIMAATLITILVLNEVLSSQDKETHVFYVTVPAAGIMLAYDLGWGWMNRKETREIAQAGRKQVAEAAESKRRELAAEAGVRDTRPPSPIPHQTPALKLPLLRFKHKPKPRHRISNNLQALTNTPASVQDDERSTLKIECSESRGEEAQSIAGNEKKDIQSNEDIEPSPMLGSAPSSKNDDDDDDDDDDNKNLRTLVSISADTYRWLQDTFPTVIAIFTHLPFALLPFSFEMFILVQGLVTNGWVPVFAYGWSHWVRKTGTIGAIGGMGFLSVVLCNFAGTNIGTTILLSRVIQAWEQIHKTSGIPIGDRTKWATIYSMALGVNYGAFSIAFSASLAGLLWRDILARKHIRVRRPEFARVNLPIICFAMTIGLAVLTGEVYLFRKN